MFEVTFEFQKFSMRKASECTNFIDINKIRVL